MKTAIYIIAIAIVGAVIYQLSFKKDEPETTLAEKLRSRRSYIPNSAVPVNSALLYNTGGYASQLMV